MRLIEAGVVLNREVVDGVHLLRLLAPEISQDAVPGQFVHFRCGSGWDPLLRRPVSLHGIGRSSPHRGAGRLGEHRGMGQEILSLPSVEEASQLLRTNPSPGLRQGEIDLLFAAVGRGTTALADSRLGEVVSLLGPLGRGFRIDPKTRNILLVAGGMGLAPLAALAAEAVRRDLTVTMLAGSRTAGASLPPWLLPPEVEYVVCTDDGSGGRKGIVTEMVPDFLEWADEIFACGPRQMLAALAGNPLLRRAPVQVSMEERMGCGVGACLGCVVRTRHGMKRVCRDGPVFDLGDIIWE